MSLYFIITAIVTLLAAAAAMSLRNLVHCALAVVAALAGLAALYLQLDAEFVGFAQILVYVGAVAILIVFAILLTRSGEAPNQSVLAPGWIYGTAISVLLFTLLGWAVLNSAALPKETTAEPAVTVKDIGGLPVVADLARMPHLLIAIGFAGAVTRRHAILALVGIELMLNAANLNFIAFWRYGPHPEALTGLMFVIFSIAIAAAEAAVGLALVIAIYRHYKTSNLDEVKDLKG